MGGGAVIALKSNDSCAGEVLLESQNIIDLCAPPTVDRLIIVADAAQVFGTLPQKPEPQVLGDVGVLVLVNQHVAEARVILLEHLRLLAEKPNGFQQQVAEIRGV